MGPFLLALPEAVGAHGPRMSTETLSVFEGMVVLDF
eukprot:CAMPEP_0168500338 /NCGR_PEP_ID=MMETSP0228-20121227/74239_1 /TAXON_ID=133427 /ORGANISM="Protoceratium reticulatum, Strain CCCM 535 (=CCMP 1889)" /LENGTH=35 /DNA_ID= /DNA_START= /DNA_END= /DNA_ORIENTATION=